MKLKDNLYKIISKHSEDTAYEIEFNPDSLIYKAHFPELPVTPGVCSVQIAGELLEENTGKKMVLKEVVNAKFLAVINPCENRIVTYSLKKVTFDNDAGICKLSAIVEHDGKTFAKLSLVYGIV